MCIVFVCDWVYLCYSTERAVSPVCVILLMFVWVCVLTECREEGQHEEEGMNYQVVWHGKPLILAQTCPRSPRACSWRLCLCLFMRLFAWPSFHLSNAVCHHLATCGQGPCCW